MRCRVVAIDLIVRNQAQEILLGLRQNRPARSSWFVPGGRIRKNETISQAFERIALAELGALPRCERFLGVFEHFYPDNFFGVDAIGTHSIALAYECSVDSEFSAIPDQQNSDLKWWTRDALLATEAVHANTKMYFDSQLPVFPPVG